MSGTAPGGDAAPDGASTEIAQLERTIGSPDWWRNANGQQERYRSLVDAREGHTFAPPAQSSAAAKEIASIERTMRTNAAAYWKSPEMQERYLALVTAREGAAAPAGIEVIGTKPTTAQSPQAILAEHDRSLDLALAERKALTKPPPKARPSQPTKARPVDAYSAMLARNDAIMAAQRPVADGAKSETGVSGQVGKYTQRATEAEARVRLPPALVEEWSKDDFTFSLWHAQRMIELVAEAIADPAAVASMEARFRQLPEGARAAALRMLAWPYPTTVNLATAGEIEEFKKLPGGPVMLDRFGKDAHHRVGMFLDRWKASQDATPPRDAPAMRRWWDTMPDLEKCSIVYILACGG